jgi:hypothetical protein
MGTDDMSEWCLARIETLQKHVETLTQQVAELTEQVAGEALWSGQWRERAEQAEQQRDAALAALREIAEMPDFAGTITNWACAAELKARLARAVVADTDEERTRARLEALSYRAALAASAPQKEEPIGDALGTYLGYDQATQEYVFANGRVPMSAVRSGKPAPAQETERGR